MAIDRGTAFGVYLLMSELANSKDGKSELRTLVDQDIAGGKSPRDAVIGQVKQQLGQDLKAMGPLPDLQPKSLTASLGIPYTGAGCPGHADQKAILSALAGSI